MKYYYVKATIEKLGKEHLNDTISKATSLSDVLRKYNLAVNGSNLRTLKNLIVKWEISLTIMKENSSKFRSGYSKKRSLNDVFCTNSNVTQAVLKSAVLRNKVLDNTKCSICKIENIWNNKPITMILDHINGLRNDNRIENLRFVCPMCNSQLDTTGTKNPYFPHNKKQNYCVECKEKISLCSVRCKKCSHIEQRKRKDRPSVEILKDCVEKLGFRETGKKYGVSDNTIRDWLRLRK